MNSFFVSKLTYLNKIGDKYINVNSFKEFKCRYSKLY